MADKTWSWEQINRELAALSPQEAETALAWLADHDVDSFQTAILYAKDRSRE